MTFIDDVAAQNLVDNFLAGVFFFTTMLSNYAIAFKGHATEVWDYKTIVV